MSSNATEQKAQGSARFIILPFVLMVFAALFAVIQYKVPSILPGLIELLAMQPQDASWLITSYTLTCSFVALIAGPFAKRVGVRAAMVVATVFAVAGSLMGLFFNQPLPLIASRAVEGVGFAIVTVAGPLAIEQLIPPERQGMATGIWGVWIAVGAFLGEVISPVVFYSPLGFVGVWTMAVIPIIVMAIIVIMLLRPRGQEVANVQEEEEEPSRGLSGIGLNFIPFLVAFLSFSVLNFAIMSYAPYYLQGVGFDPALSGFVTTIPMLLSIISSPVAGIIIDKTGRMKEVLIVALVANMITSVLLFTQSGIVIWISVIVMGLLAMMTYVSTLTAITNVIADKRSYPIALSIYMFIQGGGELLAGLVSPLILGPNLDNWPAFAIACGVMGATGLVCGLLTKYKKA